MVTRVDCPKCHGKRSVKVRRTSQGNVIGFSCDCGTAFDAHVTWDESTGEVVYWGLERNPAYASQSSDFGESLSEILELEKKGVRQHLGKHKMFGEQPPAD